MHRPQTPRRGAGITRRPILLVLLLAVLLPGVTRAQDGVPLEFREDPATGLATVVPLGWYPLGQGIVAREPDASDLALLAVQSAPATPEQLWSALLPQLRLDAVPEPIGTRETPLATFDLYQVDVDSPLGTVGVDVAVGAADGTSYLVLFQAAQPEFETLRAGIFLPAVDALTLATPEPTPDPATLPYTETEVTFPGGDPDVTLAGTLSVPRSPGPHPAIVLVGGSGPQDRDESLRPVSAIKPLALLADALARTGLTVLRYDDRGVAASTGDHAAASLDDFTADLAAALAWLRDRPEADPDRVGVLGHSEGGVYIASLIEAGEPLAFAVGMAAPATEGVALMVAQNIAIARSGGAAEAEIALAEAFATDLYAALLEGDTDAAAEVARDYNGALWDRQAPELQQTLGTRDEFVERQVAMLFATVGSPWFVDLLRSDAGRGWDQATMPVLGVFAGKDVQVLADQNAPLMEGQLADGHPSSRVVTLPDANHLFQAAETGGLAEYGTLPAEFTPDFLPLVTGWVAEVTGLEAPGASASPAG
jgi:dienelactone hydrolase